MNRNIASFSKDGEYLAYSTPDGCLKIWETSTGVLKQEYTPSAHLSATCSCLSWGPIKLIQHASKKQKSDHRAPSIANLQLIAMGTITGDVMFYSFTNADLHSCLNNGHHGTVNDISWLPSSNTLFTCSNDTYIIAWDICEGKIKVKWKGDKIPLYSICAIDEDNVLCSSGVIKWWSVKDKSVIKTFGGHATEICKLLPVFIQNEFSYFLSSAATDRVVNAWNLNDDSIKGSAASFVSPNEPESINILSRNNEPLTISITSKDGLLHIFKHILNGKAKNPLQPNYTIHIASNVTNTTQVAKPIPILSASLSEGLDSCLLVYGNYMKPTFERINISDVFNDVFLIRDISLLSTVKIEESASKIKLTEKTKNVKMLAPGVMTDVSLLNSTSKKRKQKKIEIKELPMEKRLKALHLSKPSKLAEAEDINIKSNSMVHLLLQGIQSKDNNMLNNVLQCGDETIIKNTIHRLPLQSILLVLKEIYVRLSKQDARNHACLRWLNVILSVHLSYLMSCANIKEYLGPINQLIEARVENFYKMLQLKGCLQILLDQTSPAVISMNAEASSEPLIEYESDSSEESEVDEANVEEYDDDSHYQIDADHASEESSESSISGSDMDN